MLRNTVFLFLYLITQAGLAQQEILLIGTKHRIPDERLPEVVPIIAAVEKYQPQVICVEYPLSTDTVSLLYHHGESHFQDLLDMRHRWDLPAGDLTEMIFALVHDPRLHSDLTKRVQLHNLYYVLSDFANAEYQAYLVVTGLASDPTQEQMLKQQPGFKFASIAMQMRKGYMEYPRMVFPIASKLAIDYVYPIDDLMTVVESDKYFNKMSDSDRKEYEAHTAVYVDKLASLPKGSNELLFLNSPEATSFITFVEPTAIDEKDTSQEFKMMAYYWNDRNKKMAGHIHAVAVAHPGKKIAVFFGAAHIRPVRAELNKLGMNYRVLTLTDIQLPTK